MVRRISMAAGVIGLMSLGTGCDLAAPGPLPPPCGGRGDAPCPTGTQCEDDPDDDCDPDARGDCPGRCEAAPCGEAFGLTCPNGHVCIDDPADDCEPVAGAAACPGVCAGGGAHPVLCGEGNGRTFVSHDLAVCAQILFICEVGWGPFHDGCGCGCEVLG